MSRRHATCALMMFATVTLLAVYAAGAENQRDAVGQLQLRFSEPSPLSAPDELTDPLSLRTRGLFISGFSAGASSSASLLAGYPDVFRGGLFLNSGPLYHCLTEPTVMSGIPPWHEPVERVKHETAIVLVWGQRDPQYTAAECK